MYQEYWDKVTNRLFNDAERKTVIIIQHHRDSFINYLFSI